MDVDHYLVPERAAQEWLAAFNGGCSIDSLVRQGKLHRLRIMHPAPGLYASECCLLRAELQALFGAEP